MIYILRILPFVGVRYTVTNRRVVVQNGVTAKDARWVNLDRFDEIEIERQWGYDWYDCGDLVFKENNVETFRLLGVSRPEAFRHVCLKAHAAHSGVLKAMQQQGLATA